MALTLDADAQPTSTLRELVEDLKREVDARDEESVLAQAGKFKGLATNPRFIIDWLNSELLHWQHFQRDNGYTAQTLILTRGHNFSLRANFWLPRDANGPRDLHDRLFDYAVPHDHNYSFLTVGLIGSGYTTSIYEYDRTSIVGVQGEKVDLRFLETTTLPAGKVMFYRACRDVHVQAPPIRELSVSMNLLMQPSGFMHADQFLFDLDRSTVVGHGVSTTARRVALCRLARHLGALCANDGETPGGSRTAEVLEALGVQHPCPRTRMSALESAAALSPSRRVDLWRQALADSSPAVQLRARTELDDPRI